jgi:hypothetical protein
MAKKAKQDPFQLAYSITRGSCARSVLQPNFPLSIFARMNESSDHVL